MEKTKPKPTTTTKTEITPTNQKTHHKKVILSCPLTLKSVAERGTVGYVLHQE